MSINVIQRFDDSESQETTEIKGLQFLTGGMDNIVGKPIKFEGTIEEPTKRRGRPKKKDSSVQMYRGESERKLSMMESKDPYIKTYDETNKQLQSTINGIDLMAAQIEQDLAMVRGSKTLKKKYDYICELVSTSGSLVANRISAIRELNNSITNSHRLEMNRAKQIQESNEGIDDDRAIMDTYNAFIHTPMGNVQSLPSGFNVPPSILNGGSGLPITKNGVTEDQMYQSFVNNPSPEMSAIALEKNPNIKIVVVYNQETQDKYFDVVDVSTGKSVPGIERPSDRLLNTMDINLRDGIARNLDANIAYDLVMVGNRRIDEY